MASYRLNFTKAALIKAPPAGKGKRDYHYDTKERGLILAVTDNGAKSFYLYKRIEGRPERVLLGRFPDISIENARTLAAQAKGRIAHGGNPQNDPRRTQGIIHAGELGGLRRGGSHRLAGGDRR